MARIPENYENIYYNILNNYLYNEEKVDKYNGLLFIESVMNGYYKQYEVVLEHFKENYYQYADFKTHYEYLILLQKIRANTGNFPTKKDFFKHFYRECYCQYSYNLEEYVDACSFYMKYRGDIIDLSCFIIHFFSEFKIYEQRDPCSLEEFSSFLRRVLTSMTNPEALFENDVVLRPVENKKLEDIKKTISELKEKEDCSLCQEDICVGQKGVRLDCGHFYHSENSDCCETGTIFKWFETNRTCPTCRKEMI